MFDGQEFVIHVYCVMCEYYKRLFPDGVRERGFEPVFAGSEALTPETAGNTPVLKMTVPYMTILKGIILHGFPNCRNAVR